MDISFVKGVRWPGRAAFLRPAPHRECLKACRRQTKQSRKLPCTGVFEMVAMLKGVIVT